MAFALLIYRFMKTILIALLIFSATLSAQDFRDNQELIQHLQTQSGLLTIKLVPGDKTIQVFVVGYEKANLKLDKLGIEATIKVAGADHKLKVSRDGDHFNVERSSKEKIRLNLKIDDSKNTSILKFDVP